MRISDWSSDGCSSDLDRDDVGADLDRLARGIDHANTLWLGFGARQEAVTDLVHERQGFLFEAVFITACPRATQTFFRIDVEQQGEIGPMMVDREFLACLDARYGNPFAGAPIGIAGIGEAIHDPTQIRRASCRESVWQT